MTREEKEKMLLKLFDAFRKELTTENLGIDDIIEDADCKERYYYNTPEERPYETYLRRTLADYIRRRAEDWGWN